MKDQRKGIQTFGKAVKTPAFVGSLIIAGIFLIFGTIWNSTFSKYVNITYDWIVANLGWSFILGATAFLIVAIYLMISPLGEIKLGDDDENPAYSTPAWFAMLFSAGMGIGLLFWGVSEPVSHFMTPPVGDAETAGAVHTAMQYSFFHWGLHPWAIYAVVAAALAYFSYRKNLPMLLSSTLEPLLGRDNLFGFWGNTVNIIGVISTLFGISTSLGLGVMQIGGGFEILFGIPNNTGLWLIIIVVITGLAIISTTSGIDKGIKWLSQGNLGVAGLLMLFVLVLGPTLFILELFTHSTGSYIQNFFNMSLGMDAAGEHAEDWYDGWTIFYWAWWIAWAPFVGSFIARVSRGRTIRSFTVGVLLVPTAVSMVWFSIFGGAGLFNQFLGDGGIYNAMLNQDGTIDEAKGFFAMLEMFPFSEVLIVIAMISLTIFFITSSDSGTYVIGMFTSRGNENPPLGLRIIWGLIEGGFAAVLLMAGGLAALQTASIIGGFPFMIIMFIMIYCLIWSLRKEVRDGSLPQERARIYAALEDLREEKKIRKGIIQEQNPNNKDQ
ncbi:BCCT family transporter [Aquisalibacillus elongatus]|uniref:Glycine betaine transporter n=1 Tax=Aquisalibacillus elongatus TaxID=485577 RepID=A0A3N5BUW9_9BACI|nr:BCCT family transporter [Aquisalibacillus elongatus]RPF51172.1 glycine betaine transporter [Aquisalibacillus elongatus]